MAVRAGELCGNPRWAGRVGAVWLREGRVHRRGIAQIGQIEYANGGTLFLDEIGDMPIDLQGHLLRFLQEGQIRRVGGRETVGLDVRIVSATNVRLGQAIAEVGFARTCSTD